ncbi:uncharacterized protein PAC_14967 [Phialocephala subalpina]|uniref:DUF7779 domain-containing protein n=1 Tax=Phialocephala subalpina TaxID=576137 RepID=A0A1L7XJC2_9HELO|nr:uncharacterized protein PAC_14967 [Phialocephala subalpina]
MHSPGPAARFRILYEAQKVSSFIVVIPGLGISPPESWGSSHGQPWLETLLSNAAPNSSILCFDHGLSTEDTFSWPKLVESGDALLQCLLKERENEAALCLAQLDIRTFGGLISVVSGIILMGTPHSKQAADEVWRNISLIPKASLKKFSKQEISKDEMSILINISTQFEEINDTPIAPILSAYEKRETKIRSGLGRFQVKSTLLVKREFSLTHIHNEKYIELDADHTSLCDISSQSDAYTQIATFIRESIGATQRDIFLDNASSHRSAEQEDQEDYFATEAQCTMSGSMSPGYRTGGDDDYREARAKSPPFRPGQFQQKRHEKTTRNQRTQISYTARLATFDLISEASDFSQRDPKLPCFFRKSHIRNHEFFGRQDVLRKMEDALLPRSSTKRHGAHDELRTFGLCGLGGVGKTEVAVRFMFDHRDDFDAIFWVQADEAAKLAEDFCQIALELGLEDPGTVQNKAVSRDLVKKWLTWPLKHNRRPSMPSIHDEFASWLLILDNVDEPEILKEYWPFEGSGSILVTSRDPLAKGRAFRMTSGHTLKPFEERESAEFLVGLTQNDSDDDDDDDDDGREQHPRHHGAVPSEAISVAQRLGGLPLALTQMAGIINFKRLSYKDFLSQYDQGQRVKELHALRLGIQDTTYKHTLSSVWALDRLSRGALALLEVISLVDPDRIPEDILTGGEFKRPIEGYLQDTGEYHEARAELVKSSLITRNKQQEFVRVHRLTQDGVRAEMDGTHLETAFDTTVSLIVAVWPFVSMEWRHGTSRWEKCEACFPHVLRLKNFYLREIIPENIFKAGINFAKLLNDVGWYFYERSIPENCETFFQLAQEICESQEGEPDEEAVDLLSEIYYSRGADASEVNEPERCMEYTTKFWKLRLKHAETSLKGQRDLRLGMSYNQMGVAYLMNRDYESAVGVLKKAFEVYASLDDPAPIKATLPAANMGLAYWFLRRYDEAYTVLIGILREREKVFGKNDKESFKTGRVLHALGNVRASQGRLKESYDFHQRALMQYRSTIGDNHHRTADVKKLPSSCKIFMNSYDSRKLLEQALKVFSSRIHYRHEKARTDHLMGKLMALKRNVEMSEQHFSEAFVGYQMLKPDDPRSREELSDTDYEELVCFWSC